MGREDIDSRATLGRPMGWNANIGPNTEREREINRDSPSKTRLISSRLEPLLSVTKNQLMLCNF